MESLSWGQLLAFGLGALVVLAVAVATVLVHRRRRRQRRTVSEAVSAAKHAARKPGAVPAVAPTQRSTGSTTVAAKPPKASVAELNAQRALCDLLWGAGSKHVFRGGGWFSTRKGPQFTIYTDGDICVLVFAADSQAQQVRRVVCNRRTLRVLYADEPRRGQEKRIALHQAQDTSTEGMGDLGRIEIDYLTEDLVPGYPVGRFAG